MGESKVKKTKATSAPRKFAASATVSVSAVHAAAGSRHVAFEIEPDGRAAATGVLTIGGAQFGPNLKISAGTPRTVNVPDLPMEYVGQTAGSGAYTLRAKVDGKTIGSTTGTAPDFFTMEF